MLLPPPSLPTIFPADAYNENCQVGESRASETELRRAIRRSSRNLSNIYSFFLSLFPSTSFSCFTAPSLFISLLLFVPLSRYVLPVPNLNFVNFCLTVRRDRTGFHASKPGYVRICKTTLTWSTIISIYVISNRSNMQRNRIKMKKYIISELHEKP